MKAAIAVLVFFGIIFSSAAFAAENEIPPSPIPVGSTITFAETTNPLTGASEISVNGVVQQPIIYRPNGFSLFSGASAQQVTLHFRGEKYFDDDGNSGHFAVITRGTTSPKEYVEGRGVALGNVSQYVNLYDPLCTPAPYPGTVTIESFYQGGNCVFGETTSPRLNDGVWYSLVVQTENLGESVVVTYQLSRWNDRTGKWVKIHAVSTEDTPLNTSLGDRAGLTIAHAFDMPEGSEMTFILVSERQF